MDWLTVREVAGLWGLSIRRVTTLCATGRIPGAVKKQIWLIPSAAKKPGDARIKSGKYIGVYQKYKNKRCTATQAARS